MAKRTIKQSKASKDDRSVAKEAVTPESQRGTPKTFQKRRSIISTLGDSRWQRALQLVLLAALYAPISQLNLSPIYGEIPAAYYHRYGLTASFLVAYLLRGHLPPRISRLVTPFCFWVPTIQLMLFRFSSLLSNPWGPVITESLTCYPVVVLSIYVAMQGFDEFMGSQEDSSLAEAAP